MGSRVSIPKIKITSAADGDTSFKLTRLQYPVRVAFSMTMNKNQGQSLKFVGVNLREEVFSHGQLYVALSRAASGDRVSVLLPETESGRNGICRNEVYREVFQ
jgi:ATP-dependent exoDNAse (exonuclease V) alpha subunit